MAKKQQIILLHGDRQLTANQGTDGKELLVKGETAVYNAEKAEDVEFYATAKDGSLATFQTAAKTNAAIKELADVLGSETESTGLIGRVDNIEAALGLNEGEGYGETILDRVADLEDRADAVEGRAGDLEGRADAVEGRVDNLEDFLGLNNEGDDRIAKLEDRADDLEGKVTTLIGNDADMSARAIVQDEVALQLKSENISESFDTLKEMAEWLSSHPADVTEMNHELDVLEAALEGFVTRESDGEGYESLEKVATVQSAIEGLQGQIDAIAGDGGTLANALADAKAYTDQQVSAATETLKSYADQAEVDAITSAKTYTNSVKTAVDAYTVNGKAISTSPVLAAADLAIADVKDEDEVVLSGSVQDAFGQVVNVILENEKVNAAALNDLNTRLDAIVGEEGELANALADAKAYTDQQVSAATETLKSYADQAEADAITEAKAYTDSAETRCNAYADAAADAVAADLAKLVDDLGFNDEDGDRITKLEDRADDLEARVVVLETVIDGGTY